MNYPQRGLVAPGSGSNAVKPVQGPVETIEVGPLKASVGSAVIITVREQEITRGAKGLRRILGELSRRDGQKKLTLKMGNLFYHGATQPQLKKGSGISTHLAAAATGTTPN